jgi:hypothetical protein
MPPIVSARVLRARAGVCLLLSGCLAGETAPAADGERPPRARGDADGFDHPQRFTLPR